MKNLYKALAAFQQEVPVIHKGTQGYGYTYADLPAIFEVINPLLKKHGLGFTQLLEGNSIKTIIFHCESGESIESACDIPQDVTLKGMNSFQVMGSGITYMRRYALSSALGLVTDKDIDGAGNQVKPKQVKPNVQKSNEPTQWLNADSAQWNALENAINEGKKYTISQIREKYKVSKEVAAKLEKLGVS